MRRLSKKAGNLIVDFGTAAEEMTRKAIQPNLNRFYETRQALMDYIKDLEARIAEVDTAGENLAQTASDYMTDDPFECSNLVGVRLHSAVKNWVSITRNKESEK